MSMSTTPIGDGSMDEVSRHCDDYIHDSRHPMCLRWFLLVNRMPVADQMLARTMGVNPRLFADHAGARVRVTMASRLGDVGITHNFKQDTGYQLRVAVQYLSNFGENP